MERQSKEVSQTMWQMELESAGALNLTEEHKKLVDIVTEKINDYTLTYDEYVADIAEYLGTVKGDEDPKTVIKNMCETLYDRYNSFGNSVEAEEINVEELVNE